MANRSLGTLTLDLIAKIGGFKAGMDQASRIASTSTKNIESSFTKLSGVFTRVFGALSIGVAINKVIDETSKAQAALSQLNAIIASTGGAAGYTADQIVAMSKEIQNTTTFSDEAAQSAAALFLQMNKLSGPQIQQAMTIATNISARFGKSLEESATLVARATSGSSRGIERLRSVFTFFTREQKLAIKEMERLGDTAGITALVLNQLEKDTAGAAAALRNTLGGALTGLKNAFGDVFELDSSQTGGAVDAINLLAVNLDTIASVAIKAGVAYAGFKAVVLTGNLAGAVAGFFAAQREANVATVASVAATRAKAVAESNAAAATALETRAELERTFAMVQGTRATVARIAADEASTASAATRATVLRNAAAAEGAFVAAAGAHAVAGQAAAVASAKVVVANKQLAEATAKAASKFGLLLAPFRSIAAMAAANPFTAIALGIGAATIAFASFADKIKLTADGVVTLENATQAVINLTQRALVPIGDYFSKRFEELGNELDSIVPDTIDWGVALQNVLATIPGMQEFLRIIGKIGDEVEIEARRIAAIEAQAEKARKANASAATGPSRGTAIVGDPAALKRIKDMVQDLEKQNRTLDQGAVAALKYSLAQGELAELFKSAGAGAEKYKEVLIRLTTEHEALEAAAKKSKEVIAAKEKIDDMTDSLQEQVDTFGLGEAALFEYSLAHGDLAETFTLLGAAAGPLKDKLIAINNALEAKKTAKELDDIRIQLLELRGESSKALDLKFQIDFEGLIQELERTGNVIGLELVAQLKDATLLQADFNEERENLTRITEELALQEERIRNSQETGAISELEAMFKIGEEREKALVQMRQILTILEQIAAASGNPALLDVITQIRGEIESLATETNLLAQKMETDLKNAFSSSFTEFVKGTKSAEDAFKDFIGSMIDSMLDLLSQNIAEQLFGGLSTAGGGAAGGFFGFLQGLFGGGDGLAEGGPFRAGSAHLVGERGPELAVFGASGTVIPNEKLGGDTVINNYMDNRGATQDLIRALPAILDERDRRLVTSIREARSRGIG
jgi:hypothetical protein